MVTCLDPALHEANIRVLLKKNHQVYDPAAKREDKKRIAL
jgi:hypothetical protein